MGQRSSERDRLGHRKKMTLHRTLAHSRGQDGTGLDTDTEKRKPGGGFGIGQDK